MRGGRPAEFAALLILLLGAALGFAAYGPPRIPGTGAAAATTHLRFIAAAPHATGSRRHDEVRDYIVDKLRAAGFDAHIQSATGFNTMAGPIAATVANVVARKHGTMPGPAILLMAHYDAVPRSFGAGDDGAGVAALLSVAEALRDAPPLDRDVMIVVTDAEEDGLLGAEAFVDLHPWAKDVGWVLNFDSRGTRGPVYMFQTSPGNARLINALAQVDGARANSLSGEVYRHLPSDTDLSIWLHSAFAGGALNFANIDNYPHYHTPMDDIASLDSRATEQMYHYAWSLTQALGHGTASPVRTSDAIYFVLPIVGLVHYPGSWALILAVDSFALVLLVLALSQRDRALTWRGLGAGAMSFALSVAVPAIVMVVGLLAVKVAHPAYRSILQNEPYNARWYTVAAFAFTVAAVMSIQRRFSTRASALEMALPAMVIWGIAGLLLANVLPGGTYLVAWPLFAATMAASWWRRTAKKEATPSAWIALLAWPMLLLWPPLLVAFEVGLTMHVLPLCVALLAMSLTMVQLPLHRIGALQRPVVIAATVIGVIALIGAELNSGFNAARKHPDSLALFIDADSSKAWWFSYDRATDDWTRTVLGASPDQRNLASYGITDSGHKVFAAPAPMPAIPERPHLLARTIGDSSREIALHIDGGHQGEMITIMTDTTQRVSQMIINGRVLSASEGDTDKYHPQYVPGKNGAILRYFGTPPEGIDVSFVLAGTGEARVTVVRAWEIDPPTPRPARFMSKPFVATDMIHVGWTLSL